MTDAIQATVAIVKPARHKWAEPMMLQHKTERLCTICQLVKVTRHEPGEHPWLEFFRDGERVVCERTPACDVATTKEAEPA